MKHLKFGQDGHVHFVIPILAVLAVGVIGTYLLLHSRAATAYANVYGVGGKCMQNRQQLAANANVVELSACNNTTAQQWRYNANGTISNVNGYCLATGGNSIDNGTPIHIWTCDGKSLGQQWIVNRATQSIINTHSGKCLDDPKAIVTDGTPLQIWSCNGNPQQNWTFGGAKVKPLVTAGDTSKCVRAVGPFTTNRTNTVQGNGNTFVPTGITISTFQAYPKTQFGSDSSTLAQAEKQIKAVADSWCANTVRLQIEQDAIAENTSGYMDAVKSAVAYAKSLGLVVVLNAQTEPATAPSKDEPFPTSETVTFWHDMDKYYASDPQVIYDLFNEPRPYMLGLSNESDRWQFWRNGGTRSYSYNGKSYTMSFMGAQALADAVRKDSSHNLFWVEANETDDLLDYLVAQPSTYLIQGDGPIVYSYHHPKQDSSTWDAKFGNMVKNNIAPIVDGEWPNFAVSDWQCWSNAPTTVPNYLSYLEHLGVGITGWTLGWAHINGVGYGFLTANPNDYATPNTYKSNWSCTDALGQGAGQVLQNWFIRQNGYN